MGSVGAFCQLPPSDLDQILSRAQQAQQERDFPRATQEYREACKLQPSAENYEKLGLACFLSNMNADAIDAFSEAIRLAPERWASQLFLGVSLYKTSRFEQALPHIRRALELNPNENDAHYWLGLTYLALSDYQQAIEQLLAAFDKDPENVDVMYSLTEAYLDFSTVLLKRLETQPLEKERRDLVDMRLARDLSVSESADTWEQRQVRLRDLVSRYAITSKTGEPNSESAYNLSRIYAELARAMAERIWSVKPDSYRSHELLGEAYAAKENYERALDEFRATLRLDPQAPGLHYSIGHAYWKMKRFEEAIPEIERELAANPHNASANYVLGHIYLYLDRQQPEKAARYLQRAVETKPDFVEARKQWGKALSLLHQNQKALQQLELAAEADPEDDSVHYLLAGVYKILGEPEKAQRELEIFNHLRSVKHHHASPGEPAE